MAESDTTREHRTGDPLFPVAFWEVHVGEDFYHNGTKYRKLTTMEAENYGTGETERFRADQTVDAASDAFFNPQPENPDTPS